MQPALGVLIRQRRKVLHLRQWDVASACSVDQATVSLWENGFRMPSAEQLATLATLLDIDPSDPALSEPYTETDPT